MNTGYELQLSFSRFMIVFFFYLNVYSFIHSFIHSLIFLFSQAPIPVPPQHNRMIQYNFQEEFGKCQAEQSVGF